MEILQFKDLGDTSVVSECSLGVNLVIDIFYVASDSSPLYKFESNRTSTYGDIAFCRFGGYKCRLAANPVVLVLGVYQISIAKNLRGVSTLISNFKEIG